MPSSGCYLVTGFDHEKVKDKIIFKFMLGRNENPKNAPWEFEDKLQQIVNNGPDVEIISEEISELKGITHQNNPLKIEDDASEISVVNLDDSWNEDFECEKSEDCILIEEQKKITISPKTVYTVKNCNVSSNNLKIAEILSASRVISKEMNVPKDIDVKIIPEHVENYIELSNGFDNSIEDSDVYKETDYDVNDISVENKMGVLTVVQESIENDHESELLDDTNSDSQEFKIPIPIPQECSNNNDLYRSSDNDDPSQSIVNDTTSQESNYFMKSSPQLESKDGVRQVLQDNTKVKNSFNCIEDDGNDIVMVSENQFDIKEESRDFLDDDIKSERSLHDSNTELEKEDNSVDIKDINIDYHERDERDDQYIINEDFLNLSNSDSEQEEFMYKIRPFKSEIMYRNYKGESLSDQTDDEAPEPVSVFKQCVSENEEYDSETECPDNNLQNKEESTDYFYLMKSNSVTRVLNPLEFSEEENDRQILEIEGSVEGSTIIVSSKYLSLLDYNVVLKVKVLLYPNIETPKNSKSLAGGIATVNLVEDEYIMDSLNDSPSFNSIEHSPNKTDWWKCKNETGNVTPNPQCSDNKLNVIYCEKCCPQSSLVQCLLGKLSSQFLTFYSDFFCKCKTNLPNRQNKYYKDNEKFIKKISNLVNELNKRNDDSLASILAYLLLNDRDPNNYNENIKLRLKDSNNITYNLIERDGKYTLVKDQTYDPTSSERIHLDNISIQNAFINKILDKTVDKKTNKPARKRIHFDPVVKEIKKSRITRKKLKDDKTPKSTRTLRSKNKPKSNLVISKTRTKVILPITDPFAGFNERDIKYSECIRDISFDCMSKKLFYGQIDFRGFASRNIPKYRATEVAFSKSIDCMQKF